jgi:hypothetical protein
MADDTVDPEKGMLRTCVRAQEPGVTRIEVQEKWLDPVPVVGSPWQVERSGSAGRRRWLTRILARPAPFVVAAPAIREGGLKCCELRNCCS